jgi:hypothetical protein
MKKRELIGNGDGTFSVPLGGKRGEGKFAIIDEDFVEVVNKFNWNLHINGYASTASPTSWFGKTKTMRLHHFIVGQPIIKGLVIDHKNGNKLDNRVCNLQIITNQQNIRKQKINNKNTSGYKGVCWIKRDKKWLAYIYVNCKGIYLGRFDDPTTAAQAYDSAARKYFGGFANCNFQEGTNDC